jgi:hypothetical protein
MLARRSMTAAVPARTAADTSRAVIGFKVASLGEGICGCRQFSPEAAAIPPSST